MYDLLIKKGHIVDPKNNIDMIGDIALEDGKVVAVSEEIEGAAKETIDVAGKLVIPGIIDMHTHMRTLESHPHAQRMVALAGVCTTLDMAGPLENILDTIPTSGSGINIAILEGARAGLTLTCNRPDAAEQNAFINRILEHGGIGIKLLGGHFPMDLDISAQFIEKAASLKSWVAWHVGNTVHGSNIEGMRDAVEAAGDHFLHIAHINSYCRAQVRDEISESLEAVDLLKNHPQIFSESYVSDLNGTRLTCKDGVPISKVTCTCLKKVGCTPDEAGVREAIRTGRAGVCYDNGTIGALLKGEEGVKYWESQAETTGSFSVNPATSRFLVATTKRQDGSFVVDSFSTDGGCYPRNVIVDVGLSLVKFGAMTLKEYVLKASINGAKALNLPNKGHLGIGADADISIIDYDRQKAYSTIVGGKVIMLDGKLLGKGTTIICDERGADYLAKRGISHIVKGPLVAEDVAKRIALH